MADRKRRRELSLNEADYSQRTGEKRETEAGLLSTFVMGALSLRFHTMTRLLGPPCIQTDRLLSRQLKVLVSRTKGVKVQQSVFIKK